LLPIVTLAAGVFHWSRLGSWASQ